MDRYIVLNQEFCTANSGYENDNGMFFFRQTISGHYVAAEKTLYDFPELFENDTLLFGAPVIALEISDFPVQPRN